MRNVSSAQRAFATNKTHHLVLIFLVPIRLSEQAKKLKKVLSNKKHVRAEYFFVSLFSEENGTTE